MSLRQTILNRQDMKLTKSELMLLTILLLVLFLRVYHLGHESIWLDEAVSIDWAKLKLFQILNKISISDINTHYII